MGKNTYDGYNELISLDDGNFYVQGLYDENNEESAYIQLERRVDALMEFEKEEIEEISERYL
jgi:hypothetical protein